jgi:hypothetical protein
MQAPNRLNRYSVLVTALLLGVLALASQAASQSAGVVLLVSGTANAQVSGEASRALNRRADIFVGDRITTANESQLQLRMKDGAVIALGANAEFVVKAYSDNAAGDPKDQAVLSLVKGGLRTISGQIDKSAYSMETPTATLGIRGTVFDVYVRADGTTIVILRDGEVVVKGEAGGQQVLNKPGQTSIIQPGSAPDQPETPPQDVLDYLRGIMPDLPDGVTWESDGNGGAIVRVGEDIINIINDLPPDMTGSGDIPGTPFGGAPAGCAPNDFACGCRQDPYGCAQ